MALAYRASGALLYPVSAHMIFRALNASNSLMSSSFALALSLMLAAVTGQGQQRALLRWPEVPACSSSFLPAGTVVLRPAASWALTIWESAMHADGCAALASTLAQHLPQLADQLQRQAAVVHLSKNAYAASQGREIDREGLLLDAVDVRSPPRRTSPQVTRQIGPADGDGEVGHHLRLCRNRPLLIGQVRRVPWRCGHGTRSPATRSSCWRSGPRQGNRTKDPGAGDGWSPRHQGSLCELRQHANSDQIEHAHALYADLHQFINRL